MAKRLIAFANSKGALFATPDAATVSDLELLLQNPQFALQVFSNRKQIEAIFAQHDEITGETPTIPSLDTLVRTLT